MKRSYLIASAILTLSALLLMSSREDVAAQQVKKVGPQPEYILVEQGRSTIEAMVTEKMREGFTPVGGISSSGQQGLFYQAMVR